MSEQPAAMTVVDQDEGFQAPAPAAPQTLLVRPAGTAHQIIAAFEEFERVKQAIIRPSDKLEVQGREFLKKEGFTKLQMAYAISTGILDERIDYDAEGNIVGAWVKVRATAPNGRHTEGTGYNSIEEPRYTHDRDDDKRSPPRWRKGDPIPTARQKLRHDLAATAETRATNRALARMFPGNLVSWEEVDAGAGYVPIDPGPEIDAPDGQMSFEAQAVDNGDQRSDFPKASPYKPASANQLATIEKFHRLLGLGDVQLSDDMTSADASDMITELSREYNERKGTGRRSV